MKPEIAIVGIACQYPDARSPRELWENVLAQRRAFRRLPDERLRLDDYYSADRDAPDSIYCQEAAVIDGWEFDRVKFRLPAETVRSADPAHWLALDIADQALADASFPGGEGLPREMTGVLIGNTLTGEFSRSSLMRLRWPYVRRVLAASLDDEGWPAERSAAFLERLEQDYKQAFHPVGDETLAGGLANTIAGRICNYFDLGGGGYTVDGACSSSLLAAAQSCSALVAGDLDVALVGGVDLSIDPFELVGFSKTGALAEGDMRVFDTRSDGFLPGEGCGILVLMRRADAVAQNRRIYALIRGWGVSSDGHGGITRPDASGQRLALDRAYRRAGFGIDTVAYFEAHGTGTKVGDATELEALSGARRQAGAAAASAAIGSVKANIGHTKAAAGAVGLIKAAKALESRLLPPHTSCERPHAELTAEGATLRVLDRPETFTADRPMRAAVSGMGFGGINAHLVLEEEAPASPRPIALPARRLLAAPQDAELFLFAGRDAGELLSQIERLAEIAPRISRSELTDAAAEVARRLAGGRMRAAVVAGTPAEFAARLETLLGWLREGVEKRLRLETGLFLGGVAQAPRIGLLFSGQGSPAHLGGGTWRRRFASVDRLYRNVHWSPGDDAVATEVAQPAIVTASLAGLDVLRALGIEGSAAIGHSLGELTAAYWAGACDRDRLLDLAQRRGRAMAELGDDDGTMIRIDADAEQADVLAAAEAEVVVACWNSPCKTVLSGPARALARVIDRAHSRGIGATELAVSHAFHSPLVAAAEPLLEEALASRPFRAIERRIFSTVTGAELEPEQDLRQLFLRQLTAPVRFHQAVTAAADEIDLWLQVGPGQGLAELLRESIDTPVVAIDSGGRSMTGLLRAVGAAFALGASIDHRELFAPRFTRPFDLDREPRFLVNPCELAPVPQAISGGSGSHRPAMRREETPSPEPRAEKEPSAASEEESPRDLLRRLVVERTELPASVIQGSDRFLSDLHLSSIEVGQLAGEAARSLGLQAPAAPTDYANATLDDMATALEELRATGVASATEEPDKPPGGLGTWVRAFTVDFIERSAETPAPTGKTNGWRLLGDQGHALAEPLARELRDLAAGGLVCCLAPNTEESWIDLFLEAAGAIRAKKPERFVLVHQGGGGGGFARTLHLESGIATSVVDVPFDHPKAAAWVAAEARASSPYSEACYSPDGRRREPVLRRLEATEEADGEPALGAGDVLLVSGGGKGIAAECALALARESGARLALLGRSSPDSDADLCANLERMRASGAELRYASADVTDARAVTAAVGELQDSLGPVTAILHGAGVNQPKLLSDLSKSDYLHTVTPKVLGLRHLLASVPAERLRLLLTFGSIIARTGMRGEADYAVANEWLGREVERFAEEHPSCRCLNVEWSVWSGVGMGERLGRVDALVREGISPISPDEGVAILGRLLKRPPAPTSVVVTGRFGDLPTLRLDRPELPFLRFLETPRVVFPGIELIADAELSADSDPYIADHVFRNQRLWPAVLGLEAMAQAAMATTGSNVPPVFENVRFDRPISVPEDGQLAIRTLSLADEADIVDVAIESQETAFQAAHFRARCRFGASAASGVEEAPVAEASTLETVTPDSLPARLPVEPETDLYGGPLFHQGRFRRLTGYRVLTATHCLAEIAPSDAATAGGWFSPYLPAELALGDPGARDAAIHAVQACVPHSTVLPIGVDRLVPGHLPSGESLRVAAHERLRDGDLFVYDLELRDTGGRTLERWEGLRLRAVGDIPAPEEWSSALFLPYVERRVEDLVPRSQVAMALRFCSNGAGRRERSAKTLRRLLGDDVQIHYRGDGKPEVAGGRDVSVSHADPFVLAISGRGPLGCDLEAVKHRSGTEWADLLGPDRLRLAEVIARERDEAQDHAAARVWAAGECLTKAGIGPNAPLELATSNDDGWVLLTSGALAIPTFVARLRETEEPLALAVLATADAAIVVT
ncbi:MAG: SDR family NAD(P)-dependent oxidoreductase [bacterium]|nr:SDR family NAD(P)-dependent oxidoreductase [bacterium]